MRPSSRPLPALQTAVGAGRGGAAAIGMGIGGGPLPMRQQSASNAAAASTANSKSPEMVAWLRRKEYDPRRAATEQQQKLQQQQQQLRAQSPAAPLACAESTISDYSHSEELFTANRSLSAAVNSSSSAAATKASPFARWRAATQNQNCSPSGGGGHAHALVNRSHDDLSRLGESLDEESLLGLGGPDSCTSSLQRTVDELTQKCHKSIALLKLCNQSALSPSVEQLLERVVESGGATTGAELSDAAAAAEQLLPSSQAPTTGEPSENISDRLERLSSAFDAIQKYLEEQTGAQGGGSGGNVAPGAGGARTLSGTFTKKKHPTELSLLGPSTTANSQSSSKKPEEF